MKYFVCFILFLLFAFALFLWQRAKRNLNHTLLKNFFKQKYDFEQKNTPLSLFADDILEMAVFTVLHTDRHIKNQIFRKLRTGDEHFLFAYIKKEEQTLYQLLNALYKHKPFLKEKTFNTQTPVSKLAFALICESEFEYEKIANLLKDLPFFGNSKPLRQLKKLLSARRFFFKTDLKKASKILNHLGMKYQKDDNALKTAYVCLMLGQVYRLAKAFDIAQIMFEKAHHIYKHLGYAYGQNLALAELGLNCLPQGRFDDAHTYFKQARLFYAKHKNTTFQANILSWQSCCHLGQNDFKRARYATDKALKLHQQLGSRAGMAFSLELKAAAFWGDHNHKMAESCTKSALLHYRKLQNRTAELKMLYMLTKIHLDAQQISKAKKAFNIFCKQQNKYNLPFFEDTTHIKEMLNLKKHSNK